MDIKIAVIGTGKTGGEVLKLLDDEHIVGPFNSSHLPTVEKLQAADAAIIFVPASAVDDILDKVLAAGLTAAWGSTGYKWPESLHQKLKKHDLRWVHASNFSLGMQIVRRCLQSFGKGLSVLDDPTLQIHEIHHTEKQDAPSGTALAWQDWLGREANITSERKGDIKGIHQLTVQTATESIKLEHEAHRRALFAQGALWAVRQLQGDAFDPGFYSMDTLFDQKTG